MAVPANDAAYLVNTTGGAFTAITEGGTVLGNTTTGTGITKALALKDNATAWAAGTLPRVLSNGLSANRKALSAGTFAYEAAGKYVIAASSDTLSGVSKNNILITGIGALRAAIARFQQSFGAKTLTAFRANRFSWTHTKSYGTAGASLASRINWVAATSAGGNSASAPAALNEYMWSPNDDNNTGSPGGDGAANPSRSVPGELVIKADWVDTAFTGGNFHDYKPITGM